MKLSVFFAVVLALTVPVSFAQHSNNNGNKTTTNTNNLGSYSGVVESGNSTVSSYQSQSNKLSDSGNSFNINKSGSSLRDSGNSRVNSSLSNTGGNSHVNSNLSNTGGNSHVNSSLSNTGGNSTNSVNSNSSATNGGQQNAQTSNYSSVYREERQAPPAYAPTALPSAPCRVGVSVGASSPFGGIAGGGSKLDKQCDMRETARAFALLGNSYAAAKILCTTDAAKKANLSPKDCLAFGAAPKPTVTVTNQDGKEFSVPVVVPTQPTY